MDLQLGQRIRRKMQRFREAPIDSAIRATRRVTLHAPTMIAHRRLRENGVIDALSRRPHGAFPPNYPDLDYLYQTVVERRPRVIFEYGSGCSTIAMAAALAKTFPRAGSATVFSFEADEAWAQATLSSIPPELLPWIKLTHSPLEIIRVNGSPLYVHTARPDVVPELLYLDGPALTHEVRGAGDVLLFEKELSPRFFMVVDGRNENVEILRRALKRRYRFRRRHLFFNSTFELIA